MITATDTRYRPTARQAGVLPVCVRCEASEAHLFDTIARVFVCLPCTLALLDEPTATPTLAPAECMLCGTDSDDVHTYREGTVCHPCTLRDSHV